MRAALGACALEARRGRGAGSLGDTGALRGSPAAAPASASSASSFSSSPPQQQQLALLVMQPCGGEEAAAAAASSGEAAAGGESTASLEELEEEEAAAAAASSGEAAAGGESTASLEELEEEEAAAAAASSGEAAAGGECKSCTYQGCSETTTQVVKQRKPWMCKRHRNKIYKDKYKRKKSDQALGGGGAAGPRPRHPRGAAWKPRSVSVTKQRTGSIGDRPARPSLLEQVLNKKRL
ncbi:RFXAP protein, partial [Climacteris rufus]|nr:RFXAP protein [Climacteris rufus]